MSGDEEFNFEHVECVWVGVCVHTLKRAERNIVLNRNCRWWWLGQLEKSSQVFQSSGQDSPLWGKFILVHILPSERIILYSLDQTAF